ncbi:MAG: aminopeptidase [Candidatus Hydrogenedentes bacterium]|nr:aminopeptidase [Candidatus Hydrogenedentota bacterium]
MDRRRQEILISSLSGLLILTLLTGCMSRRSISHARGYEPSYEGELSEFNVLGVDPTQPISDTDIAAAFAKEHNVKLQAGKAVLLIQSGSPVPDEPMCTELARHFRVAQFSGVPDKTSSTANFSKTLRLTAAQGGYDFIVCYWGVLEAEQANLATKTVSWVPMAGRFVPDETQRMRIRLRAVVVDARTGQWVMLAPEPIEARTASARANRDNADQAQVATLKEKGYTSLVETLLKM